MSGPGKIFSGEIDLSVMMDSQKFGGAPWDHSAEFNSTFAKRWNYWGLLLVTFGVAPNIT